MGAVNYDVPTELAINASGFGFAVWTTWEGEIWTNRYTPNNGWETAERVPTQGEGHVSSFPPPRVATANDGSAMIVWMENQPDAIWGSRFTLSGGWRPAELIDRGFEQYGVLAGPDVAMDAQGNAFAVWRRSADEYEVVASRYASGNGWSEAERIDDGSADGSYDIRIGMAPDGAAIAIWTLFQTGGPNIFANRYAPGVAMSRCKRAPPHREWLGPRTACCSLIAVRRTTEAWRATIHRSLLTRRATGRVRPARCLRQRGPHPSAGRSNHA